MPVSSSQLADDVVSVFKQTTILTDAQIKALPTTGIQIVPAPGAGKIIYPIAAIVLLDWTADYTNIDATAEMPIQYSTSGQSSLCSLINSVGGEVGILLADGGDRMAFFPERATTDGVGNTTAFTIGEPALKENDPITIGINNAGAGNLTGGHADNVLKVTVLYTIVDV